MPLSIGVKLGPYVVEAAIGAGGMGEVYRATDTRLNRTVALKVLPDHVAADSELKQRFEREARAISSLNHPHVCVLYDIGNQDGVQFLVMEYLEGETLSQRLLKGALPLDRAVGHAIEIAEALDLAHHQGIVHRDLKPGNIMLTKSGAKLLDFGLAKLRPRSSTPAALTATATGSPLTGQGTVMGTFQYMAPEQVEGQDADARTDIFAFGAVLYEMLTGKRAFGGKSQASVMGAIMNADPPALSRLQPATPPALDRIVRKCLAKDPDRRWDSARDLADELRWVADLRDESAPVPSPSSRWLTVGPSLLAAAALGALAVFWLRGTNEPVISEPIQFAINPPSADTLVFDSDTGPTLAISPDGQTVVYAATRNGIKQVYRRRLGELRSDPVEGTENASHPFFSSDGRSIGFFTGNAIKKVPLEGGASIAVQENMNVRIGGQASWGSSGTVLYAGGGVGSSVEQVVTTGGAAHPLTVLLPDQGESDHGWPDLLPGEQAILFSVDYAGNRPPEIFVQSLSSGERRRLVQGFAPRYSASGHLVFMRDTAVWAVGFDRDRLQIIGQPTPIVRGVRSGQFAISANGTLAYAAQPLDASRTLVWVDALGKEETLAVPPQLYTQLRLSPDGGRLAVATDGGDADVWIHDFDRETLRQLTVNPSVDSYPLWTPDGTRIVFSSTRGGARNLYWQAADGSGAVERLTTSSHIQSPWAWSLDGGTLVFQQQKAPPSPDWDIHTFSIQQRRPQPLIQTDVSELDPQVSPNGRWLAYRSDGDVWVRPFPNVDEGRWRVTTQGGGEPRWSADGKHLYFRGVNPVWMFSVDVTESPGFSAGTPKRLFDLLPYVVQSGGRNYDVAVDGRFLMKKEVGGADRTTSPATLVVIVNWAQRLNRLLSPE